jgi:cyclopropane fatty-acyl-phospholipid synthase-like methyltransferase
MTKLENPKGTWEQRFNISDYLFGEEPNEFLCSQLHNLRPGNVLSIADGEGRNSVWLAKQNFEVEAFDFSTNAVRKAQLLAEKNKVSVDFSICDWNSFSWNQSYYDNIVGIFFQFAGPEERLKIFNHIDSSLKPGGVVVLQGYTSAQLKFNTGGPGKLDNLYNEEMLIAAFEKYELLTVKTYESEINEGSAHRGMSGLIGFVAKKSF